MTEPIPRLEPAQSPGVYQLKLPFSIGWEKRLLFISDIHFDAKACQRKLLKKHLEQAKELRAPVLIVGDLLDLMQGKSDPRASKNAIRPEYLHEDYLGAVTESAADFLAPYAENILMISQGNHEFEFQRRHELSPLTLVAMKLESKGGFRPIVAPYTGWIMLKHEYRPNTDYRGGKRHGHKIVYHHGVGGNAPVTRGAIQSNRAAVKWIADCVIMGHIHQQFQMSIPRETITNRGRRVREESLHLQLGCYLQEEDGDSWSQRSGFGASALGGYWLRLYVDNLNDARPVRMQAIGTD